MPDFPRPDIAGYRDPESDPSVVAGFSAHDDDVSNDPSPQPRNSSPRGSASLATCRTTSARHCASSREVRP